MLTSGIASEWLYVHEVLKGLSSAGISLQDAVGLGTRHTVTIEEPPADAPPETQLPLV